MSSEAGKENVEPDNINVGLVSTVTIVGALLVVSIAAALTALVRTESSRYGEEVSSQANLGAVARLKEEQRAKLEAAPTWSDRAKGHVSVPIERAKELVEADLRANPYLATPLPPKPKETPDGGAAAAPGAEGSAAPADSAAPAGSAAPVASVAAPASAAAPVAPAPSAAPSAGATAP